MKPFPDSNIIVIPTECVQSKSMFRRTLRGSKKLGVVIWQWMIEYSFHKWTKLRCLHLKWSQVKHIHIANAWIVLQKLLGNCVIVVLARNVWLGLRTLSITRSFHDSSQSFVISSEFGYWHGIWIPHLLFLFYQHTIPSCWLKVHQKKHPHSSAGPWSIGPWPFISLIA